MLNNQSVTIADAIVAMERNLMAIMAVAGRRGKVVAKVDPYASTASVGMTLSPDGRTYDATVIFPVRSPTARLTRNEMDRWTGYFLHEVSHVLWTDQPQWRVAVAEGLGDLTNGLEDVRIECATIDSAVAGNGRERLTELLAWAVDETPDDYDPNNSRMLPWTLAMIGRVRVCGYDLPRVARFVAKLSPSMRRVVDSVMADLAVAQSTADCLAIARRLTTASPKPVPPVYGEPEAGEPEAGEPEAGEPEAGEPEAGEPEAGEPEAGEPEAGEPEAGEPEAGEPEAGEPEAGEPEAGEPEAGEPEAGEPEAGEPEAGEPEAGEPEAGEPEAGEPEAGEPDGGAGEQGGGDGFADDGEPEASFDPSIMRPVPTLNPVTRDAGRDASGEARLIDVLADALRRAKKDIRKLNPQTPYEGTLRPRLEAAANGCSRLRTQIAAVLKAPAADDWRRRLSAGRVDGRAMGRLAAGDYSGLFARRTLIDAHECEIAVLMDGSTSMHPGKLFVSATLALAIVRAAETVGVKSEVLMFVDDKLATIKTPAERLSSPGVMERATTAAWLADGYTPLSASLAVVAERLASRARNKRRIVFAITDGACDLGPAAVKTVAERCEARGVEVIGLSIDAPVHGVFPNEVRVSSAEDVATIGLGLLARVLADRGRRAA